MKIHVADVLVDAEKRRKARPDKVKAIADSIAEIGLLNPITVDPHFNLIAGLHRLEAHKSLGLAEIECTVLDVDPLLAELAQIDENLARADLTKFEEGVELAKRKRVYEKLYPETRQHVAGGKARQGTATDNLSFAEDAAEKTGDSERTIRRYTALGERLEMFADLIGGTPIEDNQSELQRLAKMDDAKIVDILELVGSGNAGSVAQANWALIERQRQESPPLPTEGKYRILYVDPPWQYTRAELDDYGHTRRHYPSMSLAELCAMGDDIKEMAERDAVLFLWTTSPMLKQAFPLLEAWGFAYKTSFVWDKVKHNFGHYNSVRHEMLLIATRGSCTPDVKKLFDSVQSIERSDEHSEKPEEFRKIIEELYTHGNKIELFARADVPGWDTWGNEPGQHEAG